MAKYRGQIRSWKPSCDVLPSVTSPCGMISWPITPAHRQPLVFHLLFLSITKGKLGVPSVRAWQTTRTALLRTMEQNKGLADLSSTGPGLPSRSEGYLALLQVHLPKTESKKLTLQFIGPCEIHPVINPVTVQLTLPRNMKVHNVFHVSQVKPVWTRLPGLLTSCLLFFTVNTLIVSSWKSPAFDRVLTVKDKPFFFFCLNKKFTLN